MSKENIVVELAVPIAVADSDSITQVELRKPMAGELRGLSFTKALEVDVDTMVTLVPRISKLTERQMLNLDPENMAPLFTGVAGFFVSLDSPSA